MTQSEQIQQMEQRLLNAMLNSDVDELDALVSDEALVVGPDGRMGGKAEDLAAHRNGVVRMTRMVPEETTVKLLPDVAIVFVLMNLQGTYQGQPFAGRYRYTRVWGNQSGNWQIIAAHISAVPA